MTGRVHDKAFARAVARRGLDGEGQNGLWALAAVGIVVAGLGVGAFQLLTAEYPPNELEADAVSNSDVGADETVAFENLSREQRRGSSGP